MRQNGYYDYSTLADFTHVGAAAPELISTYESALPEVLEDMAKSHLVGRIALLPYDVEKYDFQDPWLYRVAGQPVPLEVADTISPLAQPGYLEERLRLCADPKTKDILDETAEIFCNNENVVVVTPHDQLIDVVMGTLVIRDLLARPVFAELPQATAVIVSKMVTRLQYSTAGITIPAIDVIKLFCNDIYLSFPRTKSAQFALQALPSVIVEELNHSTTAAINDSFWEGGTLLGLAATGTTQKDVDANTGLKKRAAITSGTAHMMMVDNVHLLPVNVNAGETFRVEIMDRPRQVHSHNEVNDFMNIFER